MKRFAFISDLTNPEIIEALTGAVSAITKTLLSGIGYSASTLERIDVETIAGCTQSFILKHTKLNVDWLSQRTGDSIGREAAILGEKNLFKIWESIHCPYIAYAIEEGQIAVLTNNLSEYLFLDVREPIDLKTEAIILNTFASLHATFWESPEIKKLDWLGKPHQYLETFGPGIHLTDSFAPPPDKLLDNMNQGWEIAFDLLPREIKSLFLQPAEKIFERWKDMPTTLLHGDTKLSNMALMPDGRIAVFDWAFAGQGPCGIELGWYIAVNSTRLARKKEEVISTYRTFLESHLHYPIEEKLWIRMVDLTVFTGAKMLLWNKALGYRAGTERGKNEWDWWIQKLKIVVEHSC
jgi:Phosphotransferase enzyme family